MNRRDILKTSALALGYTLTGGAAIAVLNGCKADTSPDWTPAVIPQKYMPLLESVVETIIPTTDTPGAAAAMVHRYIDEAIAANWKPEDRDRFIKALPSINEVSNSVGGKDFVKLDQDGKNSVMEALAKESKDKDEHIFKTLKDLTVSGYFTSEIGATEALIYDPVPGPYQGCIPLSEVGGTYALG